ARLSSTDLMMIYLQKYKRLIAVVLFLAVIFAVFQMSGLRGHFDLEFIKHKILENQLTGLLIFVLLFSLGNLMQIPGIVFLAAAVLALGQLYGGIATYIAAIVSCVVIFFIIRAIGGNALRELDNKFAVKILAQLNAKPIISIILLRTLFQTAPTLNYALAMSGVKFRDYLIGTILGLPIPIFLLCWFFEFVVKMLHIH
ncbi:MAG TPA: VTT domain-containing protein, partial [Methylobacter sp.]